MLVNYVILDTRIPIKVLGPVTRWIKGTVLIYCIGNGIQVMDMVNWHGGDGKLMMILSYGGIQRKQTLSNKYTTK